MGNNDERNKKRITSIRRFDRFDCIGKWGKRNLCVLSVTSDTSANDRLACRIR